MTGRHRAALLAMAAAIAIAAAVTAIIAAGDDDEPVAGGTTTAPVTQTAPTRTTPTETKTTPRPATPVVVVRDGKPVGGVRRLRFEKGSKIRFAVRSDVADEVHLHGYDVAKDVAAGGTARFSLTASIDGRFVVELEHRATQIAEIEVAP